MTNVFRSNPTTNKVLLNLVRGFEVRNKVRLMFSTPKINMKDKCYVFSGCKGRKNMCFVYLECKLQQYRYG